MPLRAAGKAAVAALLLAVCAAAAATDRRRLGATQVSQTCYTIGLWEHPITLPGGYPALPPPRRPPPRGTQSVARYPVHVASTPLLPLPLSLLQQPAYQTVPGKIIVKLRDDYMQVGLSLRSPRPMHGSSCRHSFRRQLLHVYNRTIPQPQRAGPNAPPGASAL